MESKLFIHDRADTPTTISELKRIHSEIHAAHFFGIYAYATQSGAAAFDIEFGAPFWNQTSSRWLLGIDYGRTQPQALRTLLAKANTEIRIHDGAWIVDRRGFIPRRDFHAKAAILKNQMLNRSGIVLGSGNFSSNGLRRSIEAGASIVAEENEFPAIGLTTKFEVAERLWHEATPVLEILDQYEEGWRTSFSRAANEIQEQDFAEQPVGDVFWIEAGYITRNRGPNRPGNQIDFPRGMGRYFGLPFSANQARNTVIGEITFSTPVGAPVINNLRMGNNLMEKVSLPIPETHGFDIYDGKVLVFQRTGASFAMSALEVADFEAAFGDRLTGVHVMASGRRYGTIS